MYQVGGSIRDELLGRPPHDLDYVVVARDCEALADTLRGSGYEVVHLDRRFGVARARAPGGRVSDFALARRDGCYRDHRHPESVEATSILEDLGRRDFTVNAMARCTVTGELLDPYGGRADLEASVLRCVGDPLVRLGEDPLRVLRAIRFMVSHGLKADAALHQALTPGPQGSPQHAPTALSLTAALAHTAATPPYRLPSLNVPGDPRLSSASAWSVSPWPCSPMLLRRAPKHGVDAQAAHLCGPILAIGAILPQHEHGRLLRGHALTPVTGSVFDERHAAGPRSPIPRLLETQWIDLRARREPARDPRTRERDRFDPKHSTSRGMARVSIKCVNCQQGMPVHTLYARDARSPHATAAKCAGGYGSPLLQSHERQDRFHLSRAALSHADSALGAPLAGSDFVSRGARF